jgi:IS1 family transposase
LASSCTRRVGALEWTLPQIARYRKEATGNLDEVQIRAIEEKLLYFRELVSRKETILASIQEQGKLTSDVKARIDRTMDKSELEDLYLPYNPKRRTKAMIAREKGLEPLADYLWNQEVTGTPLDKIRNIPCKDVELDEIWSWVFCKERAKRADHDASFGDNHCFVAIERNTKLVLNFALGKRDQATTNVFIEGLRQATSRQPYQLTADGFITYPSAIENTLSDRVDFAQLIKVYRASPEGERRYSPAEVVSTERVPVIGNPDPKRICTSIVERQNLTMRMQMRRLTRLANAFSKKWENLWAALCLHFAWYNFCRVHKSLRVTPAMESGIADHVWKVTELLA